MRGGGCTVQQALTPEAAAVVKQAVSLARRRGNAQVTPLHVASAMLQQQQQAAPPTSGLLRAACLRSHSHPLQCKALELCFNVALNRLPASTSPLLAGHGHVYYPPSLSNALVAAFKRAQAHQRRGSVDTQQQQPAVLPVKIELEQLVISILDDPSVSRVMREAGFSSTQVKANVEQSVSSIEANSSACTTAAAAAAAAAAPQNPNPSAAPSEETKLSKLVLPLDQVRDEDVSAILDGLATQRKRRVMVVAECAATAEAAARAAVDKIRRGEALRTAQVISVSVSRFRDLPRDEAELRLAELRRAVKAAGGRAGGAVLVVEDLGWAAEFWAGRAEAWRGRWPSSCCYYCAVERAVAEVRALACLDGDGVWLVGHGTYQSYMRCRAGCPSLEILWELQTLAVPAGSLALSLNCVDTSAMAVSSHQSIRTKCEASANGSVSRCMSLLDAGGSDQLMAASGCCGGCCTDAAKALARSIVPSSSSIPPWLQRCRDREPSHCKKWSSTCGGSQSHARTTLNFSAVVSPSSSVSSYEQHYHHLHQPWLVADAHETKHTWKAARCGGGQVHVLDDDDVKIVSAIKVTSHDSSASNGAAAEVECRSMFKELSAENHKVLCSALEKEVPWQAELVPEIASAVLRCRSGVARRRDAGADDAARQSSGAKEDTWLLFLGGDADGKARVARELASLVFRSRRNFVSIGGATAALSPARSDSTEQQHRSKRPRSAETASNGSCLERLYEAVRDNPHRVIFLEDVDQAGRRCQTGVLEAMESGVVRSPGGDGEVALGDAIVVLSCECLDSRSRNFSPPPPTTTKKAKREGEEASKEEEGAGDHHNEDIIAAAVSSSLSSSCFDLNVSVENDEVEESCFTVAGLLKAVDRAFFFTQPGQSSDWVASDQPLV